MELNLDTKLTYIILLLCVIGVSLKLFRQVIVKATPSYVFDLYSHM